MSAHTPGEPVMYTQAHFIARLDSRTEALRKLLSEALSAMRDEHENQEGRVAWTQSCPVCDGALPVEHGLVCRIEEALAMRGGSAETLTPRLSVYSEMLALLERINAPGGIDPRASIAIDARELLARVKGTTP